MAGWQAGKNQRDAKTGNYLAATYLCRLTGSSAMCHGSDKGWHTQQQTYPISPHSNSPLLSVFLAMLNVLMFPNLYRHLVSLSLSHSQTVYPFVPLRMWPSCKGPEFMAVESARHAGWWSHAPPIQSKGVWCTCMQ